MIINPLRCKVANFDEFRDSFGHDSLMALNFENKIVIDVPNHPTRTELGERLMTITDEININKFDFSEGKDGHYLTATNQVYLKYASATMTVEEVIRNKEGVVDYLLVRLTKVKTKPRKIKILTWISDAVPAVLNIFGNLLESSQPLPGVAISDQVNEESWKKCQVLVEKSLLAKLERYVGFEFG